MSFCGVEFFMECGCVCNCLVCVVVKWCCIDGVVVVVCWELCEYCFFWGCVVEWDCLFFGYGWGFNVLVGLFVDVDVLFVFEYGEVCGEFWNLCELVDFWFFDFVEGGFGLDWIVEFEKLKIVLILLVFFDDEF